MPIYDYLCSACDHRADILHGINDPGPNFCPSCGREGTMRKQFAAPAVHYKGSGWAKKDRGGAGGTRAHKADETRSGEAKADGSSAAKAGSPDAKAGSSDSASSESSASGSSSGDAG